MDFNLQDGEKYHSVYTLRDRDGKELTDLLEVHIIELCKELTEDSPVDGWIRLFNAETKEELAMVKSLNRNAGIAQAAEVLERLGMSRSLGWYWAQSQKARRDRAAEDAYVRAEGKAEGKAEGQDFKLITQICRKLRKGKNVEVIAEELEEDIAAIRLICEIAEGFAPEYDEEQVFAVFREQIGKKL